MNTFFMKTINLLLIVGVLLGYNAICHQRSQQEQISALEFELEKEKQTAKSFSENAAEAKEAEETSSPYTDGVYVGEAQGFGGTVQVQVEIADGRIAAVEILSAEQEDGAYLDAASVLKNVIVEAQSTEIDTVSGATFSSNGILHAAEDALRKAVKVQ